MGVSRRDYERLPSDVKVKAVALFEGLKAELHGSSNIIKSDISFALISLNQATKLV
jgi:hypothetical protein